MPGAEVVVATKELGGSASYKVWSWEEANLAVMSPPASLYEGNPVEWKLHRGEGAETAVRCTGDPSRPIEVWNFTAPYGGSSTQPAMKVTSYSYDAANGGQFGDGSLFGDEQSFSAEPQNLGQMTGWPVAVWGKCCRFGNGCDSQVRNDPESRCDIGRPRPGASRNPDSWH